MKLWHLIIALVLTGSLTATAQSKYFTRTGKLTFHSDASLEQIEASNSQVNTIIDAATGQIQFAALMKAFEFEKALMQEHFNENYVESDKFPKSVFKGKIENISQVDFTKDGTYPVKVSGQLTLHGITKGISSDGTVDIKNGIIHAKSTFNILLADFGIEIPKLVADKISKEVSITVNSEYRPLEKS